MKILHVITSLQIGGAEKLVAEIAPMLRDKGHEVDVCSFVATTPNLNNVLEGNGIKVINFADEGSVYNLKFIFKLAKLMRNYDVVHTHNTACQMFAAVGSYFCKCRLITTEHSTSTRRRNYKVFKIIDKWMYSRYDKIICISEPSEESLRNYLGSNGSNSSRYPIVTIKNGVNIRKFMEAEPIDLGIGDCKKITMVAGFRYEKDQSTVIKALKYLPEDYHVVFVGDGVKRQELEALAQEVQSILESSRSSTVQCPSDGSKGSKTIGRVHFLGIRRDVPNILKASDVIVMSSHREGLSLSNVEGMCSGHPFVASDVEGLREVTKGYGLLFLHEDSKALAEIIEKLCSDKAYAEEVANKCLERAQMYDIKKMVEEYNNVYSEIIAR